MKSMSCLINFVSSYDRMTCLVDEGKDVDVVHLHINKAFDTISQNILLEKLEAHKLDRCSLCQVENLDGQAQRVVMNGVKLSWLLVTNGFSRG